MVAVEQVLQRAGDKAGLRLGFDFAVNRLFDQDSDAAIGLIAFGQNGGHHTLPGFRRHLDAQGDIGGRRGGTGISCAGRTARRRDRRRTSRQQLYTGCTQTGDSHTAQESATVDILFQHQSVSFTIRMKWVD